jgi:RNA polymerase-binding transcription factor
MDAKKIKDNRRRLTTEYESLIKSINRNRIAAEQITIENTEDEGDLASISHDRDLLYNLHEDNFERLRFIKEAIDAVDRGHYGECGSCGKDIDEKRLDAVPWAKMCIHCQEGKEAAHASSRMVMAGHEAEDTEL